MFSANIWDFNHIPNMQMSITTLNMRNAAGLDTLRDIFNELPKNH